MILADEGAKACDALSFLSRSLGFCALSVKCFYLLPPGSLLRKGRSAITGPGSRKIYTPVPQMREGGSKMRHAKNVKILSTLNFGKERAERGGQRKEPDMRKRK